MSSVRRPGLGADDLEVDAYAFSDRVMNAIEATPAPTPARSLVGAVRGWSLDDAVASLAVAWHLATVRSWSIAPRVRARSMALVLAVASVLATGSLVAAAAVRVAAPFATDDRHAPPSAAPAGGITDPELDDDATDGTNPRTSLDADHHVAEPVAEPVSSDDSDADKADGGDTASGSQAEDASNVDDGDEAHDGDNAGTGAHENGDNGESGEEAHDGDSTFGSDDGDTSDDGSHGTSGDDDSHDGGDVPDDGGSHDGGDGGD